MASSSTNEDGTSSGEEEDSAAVTLPEEGEERRNWLELPREVMASILSRLIAVDVLNSAQFVCKAWVEISNDPLVWKRIDMYNIGDPGLDLDLEKMCRKAIDRSCGQAVYVNIEYFGNDDILKYITDRSTQIRRLRLTCCYRVSDEGLVETIAKLPLLEELELTLCSLAAETLEAVGRNCPRLRSFKLNSEAYRLSNIHSDEEDDFSEEAIAIGKTMPGLSHLQLIGNSMTDKGLKAILDGCPKLESLDLRRCLNISQSGGIWKKCTDQVKHLRLPNDSTEDYPFRTGPDDESRDNDGFFSSDDGHDYSFDDFSFPLDLDYEGGDNLSGDDMGYLDFYNGDHPFEYDDFTVPDIFW